MNIYLTVAQTTAYNNPRVGYVRSIAWEAPPPKGETIRVGREENGEVSSISASVSYVTWTTDGIWVEARIENCKDEYAAIRQSVERDEFILKHEFK